MPFSFSDFFNNLSSSQTVLQTAIRIDNQNVDIGSQLNKPFKADESYFSIWVNEMFLYNEREWFNKYEPIVYTNTEFQYGTQKKVESPFVVGRTMLADKKIPVSQGTLFRNTEVAGVHPYAGDKLTLYLVLSQYKSVDYLEKTLRLVEKISGIFNDNVRAILEKVSGMALVIKEGIESFHDSPNVRPVLGKREEFSAQVKDIMPGYFALINMPENEISADQFFVKEDKLFYGNSLKDCEPYRESDYVLYSLINVPARQDENTLPFHQVFLDLKKATGEVGRVKDENDEKDKERFQNEKDKLNEKLAVLNSQIDLSFDLITSQKEKIKDKYFSELKNILNSKHFLALAEEKEERVFETEMERKLYELESKSVSLKF